MKNILITFLFISVILNGNAYSKNYVINGKPAQEIISDGEILSINYDKKLQNGVRYNLLIKNGKFVYTCQVTKAVAGGLFLNTVCYRDDSN